MKEYIVCFIFWMLFTVFLVLLGKAAAGEKKSESHFLTTGYLVYSFPVAVCGLIVQFLNLPWIVFAGCMAVIWVVLCGYIIYVRKKKDAELFRVKLGLYIRENWILYVILAAFTVMLFFYFRGFWLGNHLDDGYYITKVATLPYTTTGYATNYAVGVGKSGFDSYLLNTWELEASVYVKLLGVNPALFLRLFQSVFYYFLFLNVVKGFAENILKKLNVKIKSSLIQFPVLITLLFGMYYIFLFSYNILPLRDTFHFNTGMFLGATMPKMLGIILLLFYFTEVSRINLKMILSVAAISLVMISKTTIVLPVLIVTVSSYFIVSLLMNYGKKEKVFSVAVLLLYCVAGFILPGSAGCQETLYADVRQSLHSPVVVVSLVIFLGSFLLKERVINKINGVMILIAACMIIPQVNDIFEQASVYRFVSGRAWTTWIYTLIILSSIYLCVVFLKLKAKERFIKAGYLVIGMILMAGIPYGFNKTGDTLVPGDPVAETDVKNSIKVILGNKYFMPESTIKLGEELEKLTKESGEKLYVVTPNWVYPNGAMHGLSVMIRTYAPDIVSVSAVERFPVNNGSPAASFEQEKYMQFSSDPNEESSEAFKEQADAAGVNCIVSQNEACTEWLEDMGYVLYSEIEEGPYYIWYR